MARYTGIWIDGSKAVIIEVHGELASIHEIPADVDYRLRVPGEKSQVSRFGTQFINTEHKDEARIHEQRKHFLEEVMRQVKEMDQIVIFGPAGTKLELEKMFRLDHIMTGKLLAVHTAPVMTQNQMAAWVRKYFKNTHVEL